MLSVMLKASALIPWLAISARSDSLGSDRGSLVYTTYLPSGYVQALMITLQHLLKILQSCTLQSPLLPHAIAYQWLRLCSHWCSHSILLVLAVVLAVTHSFPYQVLASVAQLWHFPKQRRAGPPSSPLSSPLSLLSTRSCYGSLAACVAPAKR